MRSYSVAVAALALDVDRKWLDNLLSQHRLEGVRQTRQGIQRRLSANALHVIDVIYRLNKDLGLPVWIAVELAPKLWESASTAPGREDGNRVEAGAIWLGLDRQAITGQMSSRLGEAMEIAPRVRRGRPPKKRA